MDTALEFPKKRQLPKLMACMTKNSIENFRSKALFSLDTLDAKGIRRRKLPLHECLILELRESGFFESSDYLQDLIYDNIQILAEDEIGIVIDIRERGDFLEHISAGLQRAERERDKDNKKKEAVELLKLALYYSEKGKGILWLAEKFFLAAIAVSSHYLADGGRQKACCKMEEELRKLNTPQVAKHMVKKSIQILLNDLSLKCTTSYGIKKISHYFPESDTDEPFEIFTDVRDSAIGKEWPLFNDESDAMDGVPNSVFVATVLQLHQVMLNKARCVRSEDPAKAERLSRLAERRAKDAADIPKVAEAIIEVGISQLAMNNLNNAQKSFEKAYKIYAQNNDVNGMCETKMHLAAVMQRLGENEKAAKMLTEMGAMAIEHSLCKQLGRALQLLGELHLRRDRPDLGTQHLAEAFTCFMGHIVHDEEKQGLNIKKKAELKTDLDVIYNTEKGKIYIKEAEQSRIMMAISAGQELMASYFKLIEEADRCSIAKIQLIEWKLAKSSWWVEKEHHRFIPCLCPNHKRSPLDIVWLRKMQHSGDSNVVREEGDNLDNGSLLNRQATVEDMRKLRSSYVKSYIK